MVTTVKVRKWKDGKGLTLFIAMVELDKRFEIALIVVMRCYIN